MIFIKNSHNSKVNAPKNEKISVSIHQSRHTKLSKNITKKQLQKETINA